MTTRKRRGNNTVPAAFAALIVGGATLTGCAAQEDQVAYCVDENDVVVDEDLCDDDGGTSGGGIYFFMLGNYNSGVTPGTKLDRNMGTRISPTDSAAREKAGLPKTGKVTIGKTGSYFKSGGGFGTFKGGSSGG